MELRHLETLLAIDQEGSFTAAADALNTVQSNVSDQIRQLEGELGVALLVRAGDIPRLVEVLDRLLGDPAERQRLGEAARRTVAEHFTWERCGERTLEVYRSVLG